MRTGKSSGRIVLIGSLIACLLPLSAEASTLHHRHTHKVGVVGGVSHAGLRSSYHGLSGIYRSAMYRHGMRHHGARWSGLQCVTYARSASGIELSGNAVNWWENAAGMYARGSNPEPGSVLNFRANGRMRMGHVAVVTAVVNSREIEIAHANWAGPGARRGGVSRGIPVVDVSPDNDWTAVRVGLGQSGTFGSIYPTFGFIYDRPDAADMQDTARAEPAPLLPMNPPPRDLRSARERRAFLLPPVTPYDEVAEAPAGHGFLLDAPSRNIR